MPLVKQTLKTALIAAFMKAREEEDALKAAEDFADDLATAIDAYIKTATPVVAGSTGVLT